MVRPPCCDKLNVRKGPWTAEEDAKILAYVSKHGTGNWTAVPKKADSPGLRRCGKSCRLRWTNYLRPDLKHESFTPQEEELIVKLHAAIGSRWSIIAQQLPGRTDNDVKNYWNTKLKKKLTDMGIDPVTHKPFSQILADYGSIGGLPKTGTRIGSVNRDLKNAFMTRSEKYPPAPPAGGFSSSINRHIMTMTSPKVEQIEDSFFSRNMTSNHTISNSSNLLCQLQAIKLVTEASNWVKHETVSPTFFHEGSPSSSSSSSSTCSTAGQESPSLAFSWRDFLLDDDLVPANPQPQEQQYQKSLEFTSQAQHVMPNSDHINSEALTTTQMMNNGVQEDCGALSNSFHASSSTNGFLEAILDREHDMFLEFSELLEAPFYK